MTRYDVPVVSKFFLHFSSLQQQLSVYNENRESLMCFVQQTQSSVFSQREND